MGGTAPRFIANTNVGKLAIWLRLMGYDTLFFQSGEDRELVKRALGEDRIILTRDTHIGERRPARDGRLKVMLFTTDEPASQLAQLFDRLALNPDYRPFSLCLECNRPLVACPADEAKSRVPAYVYKTHHQFYQCPECRRVYWRGTHWQAMQRLLEGWREQANGREAG